MPQPDLEWTVMVYMAGDNNLNNFGFDNLIQMSEVGSTDKVHVVAQLDQKGPFIPAIRHFVKVGGGLTPPENVTPEPNTGGVGDFLSFVRWVIKNGHEAKKYLVVLWGHAQGVFDLEDDESDGAMPVSALGVEGINATDNGHSNLVSANNPTASAFAGVIASPDVSVESPEGVEEISISHSLMPDDTSGDSMTSRELKEALEAATKELGVNKIHVLGIDACLMSMVEIARQVNDNVSLMVASEESIPNKSWPYGRILQRLKETPDMTPKVLSETIVEEYLAFYKDQDSGPVTLSACDLSKTNNLVDAVRALGDALQQNLLIPRIRRAIIRARGNTQSFLISDYVDLFHLCEHLQANLDPTGFTQASPEELQACTKIKEASQRVMKAITNAEDSGESFVISSGVEKGLAKENPLANSHGVSIYFPLILPLYRNLEFSRATQWDSFLFDYVNIVFRPTGVSAMAATPKKASVATASGMIASNPTFGGTQQ